LISDHTPDADRYAYYRQAIAGRPLPLAFVDLEAFDHNAGVLAGLAGGKPIRVATKSLRCPALLRRVLARGPAFRGLMAWAVPEAAFLSVQGFDDILVAYPSVQPAELQQAAELVKAGKAAVPDRRQSGPPGAGQPRRPGRLAPPCLSAWIWMSRPTTACCISAPAGRRCGRPRSWKRWRARCWRRPGCGWKGSSPTRASWRACPTEVVGARARSAVVRALKRDSGRRLRHLRQQAVAAGARAAPRAAFRQRRRHGQPGDDQRRCQRDRADRRLGPVGPGAVRRIPGD
jgi:hypothetical protein